MAIKGRSALDVLLEEQAQEAKPSAKQIMRKDAAKPIERAAKPATKDAVTKDGQSAVTKKRTGNRHNKEHWREYMRIYMREHYVSKKASGAL